MLFLSLNIKLVVLLILLVVSVSYLPEAFASTAGGAKPMPYVAWLDNLRASTSGPVAYTLSLIGIIVSGGILIFGGDLNGFFRTLIFIVLVTALIVAADNTLRTLQAGAEITPPPTLSRAAQPQALLSPLSGDATPLFCPGFDGRLSWR
ncbi:MAG: TrbC/VirB2 family protein [Methylococcaceae bacterium]|nr:TrbC/VirB2 family protein [Methylococcaceae bacterium]